MAEVLDVGSSSSSETRLKLTEDARTLFEAYRQELVSYGVPIDDFQGYSEEIASLPGKYVLAKAGCILIAQSADGEAAGCIAVRDLGPLEVPSDSFSEKAWLCTRVAELKRLYVAPSHRGQGIATSLIEAAMAWVTKGHMHYDCVVLDTLHRLPGAIQLYQRLGFSAVGPYCHNPMPDAVYMGRRLQAPPQGQVQ